jgi:hypothetical protein
MSGLVFPIFKSWAGVRGSESLESGKYVGKQEASRELTVGRNQDKSADIIIIKARP